MKHIDRPCDFAKWARAKNWLLEEAIYILKGKEPPPRDWLLDSLDAFNELSDTKQKQAYEQLIQPFTQGINNGTLVITQDEDDGAVHMTPSAALAWAKQTAHPVPPELIAEIEKANAPKPAPEKPLHENERCWPWGNHETKLLRKMALAAERFWRLYDPEDPTTAPTNQQVSEWLKQQDVADRVAEIMAQILRADGLPKGPRK